MARILIVEDEAIIARDIADRVALLGHEVAGIVVDGEEALARVEAAQPDLVLMDIVLRGKLDGIEIAKRIREVHAIPVVYLTAYKDHATVRRALAAAPFGFLTKPVRDGELRACVEIALYKSRLDAEQREREQRLTLALQAGALMIWEWRPETNDFYVERNDSAWWNYEFADAIQTLPDWDSFIHVEDLDQVAAARQALLTGRTAIYQCNYRMILHGEPCAWVSDVGKVVEWSESGRPRRVLGVLRDVSAEYAAKAEHEALVERLRRTEKLESLAAMAAGISHELNNTLHVLRANAEFGLRSDATAGQMRSVLEEMLELSNSASETVSRLTIYAGRRVMSVEPHELAPIVRAAHAACETAHGPGITITLDLAPCRPADINAVEVQRLVQKLIQNAAEAILPGRGTISLRTGEGIYEPGSPDLVFGDDDACAGPAPFIEVADNGAGMDARTLARAFEPFFSTRFSGRGLGLAEALGIARNHRASLSITSSVGSGTAIRLWFPELQSAKQASMPVISVPQASLAPQPARQRVIMAEGERVVRDLCERVLRNYGYAVQAVATTHEALALLAEGVGDLAENLSGVVLDYALLQGELLPILESVRRAAPGHVIVLTSGAPPEDMVPRLANQGVRYLQKPYAIADLVREFNRTATTD